MIYPPHDDGPDVPVFNPDEESEPDGQPISLASRMPKRMDLIAKRKYVVEPYLPCGQLHVIGGESGSGKTTWMLQQMYEWSQGRPAFLGERSRGGLKWVYVSCDRSLDETSQTLERIGLRDWDIPAWDVAEISTSPELIKLARRWPTVDLFVIEGLQSLIPDVAGRSQNKSELLWMVQNRREIFNHGKTVIATTHPPKTNPVEAKIGRPRAFEQQILGSQSLIGCISTKITVNVPAISREAWNGVNNPYRDVTIRPRNYAPFTKRYILDDRGRFTELDAGVEQFLAEMEQKEVQDNTVSGVIEKQIHTAVDDWLAAIPTGTKIEAEQIISVFSTVALSRATAYRWIKSKVESGCLKIIGRGVYEKVVQSHVSVQ